MIYPIPWFEGFFHRMIINRHLNVTAISPATTLFSTSASAVRAPGIELAGLPGSGFSRHIPDMLGLFPNLGNDLTGSLLPSGLKTLHFVYRKSSVPFPPLLSFSHLSRPSSLSISIVVTIIVSQFRRHCQYPVSDLTLTYLGLTTGPTPQILLALSGPSQISSLQSLLGGLDP